MCEVLHAISTSSASIEYYNQQYCTLFIGLLTADVTIPQEHLGVKLVEYPMPISSAVYHVLSQNLAKMMRRELHSGS